VPFELPKPKPKKPEGADGTAEGEQHASN